MQSDSLASSSSNALVSRPTTMTAFSSFPWHTGLPIGTCSLKESLISMFSQDIDKDRHGEKLLLELAQSLDDVNIQQISDEPRTCQNVERYLGSTADSLIDPKRWQKMAAVDISAACHLLLRFSLLDRLADAFGIPRQPSFQAVPRRSFPDSATQTFLRIIKPIAIWTDPIQTASSLLDANKVIQDQRLSSLFAVTLPRPEDFTPTERDVHTKIGILHRATQHVNSAELNNITTNMELLSFAITWFGSTRRQKQANNVTGGKEWAQEIARLAKEAGLPLREDFIERLSKLKLYDRMRNLFHLATSISPLICISTNRFQSHTGRRDQFISSTFAFGNERPILLAATERELWKGLARVNVESTALIELGNFIERFEALKTEYASLDPGLNWYNTERIYNRLEEVTTITQNLSLENRSKRHLVEVDNVEDQENIAETSEPDTKRRRLEINKRDAGAWSETSSIRNESPPPTTPTSNPPIEPTQSHRSPSPINQGPQADLSNLSPLSTISSLPPVREENREDGEDEDEDEGEEARASADESLVEQSPRRTRSTIAKGKMPERSKEDDGSGEDEIEDTFVEVDVVEKPQKKGRAGVKGRKSGGSDFKSGSKRGDRGEHLIRNLVGQEVLRPNICGVPVPKISERSFKLELFDGDHTHDEPIVHEFFAVDSHTDFEYGVLEDIQEMVMAGFIDGKPPHLQPSARLPEYDGNGSSIFVAEWDDFRKLSPTQVQAIFRHRHILIRHSPVECVEFTPAGLEMLGSLSRPVSLQVAELRGVEGEEDLIRAGTLQDLHIAGTEAGQLRIVNGLDFPLGYTSVAPPPHYRHYASQEIAWQETFRQRGLPVEPPLSDDTNWGTTATKGATTMVHIDTEGFATVVSLVCGAKYWVVMRPKQHLPAGELGDLRSVYGFPPGWSHGHTGKGVYEAEGLLLRAGDVFYMRPNTPHYVLGVENSIMLGRHFYSTSAISDTCAALVHLAILGDNVTNQDHPRAKTFLRRLMFMWADYFQGATIASDLKKAHIPDISTQDGLLDIIMLGNLLEFSRVFAGKSKGNSDVEEQDIARIRYRRFMSWFADNHLIVVDSQLVNPWYIFYRSLIEFGSSLCDYKSVWPESNTHGLSAPQLQRYVTEHIKDQWPLLLPRFLQLRKSPTHLFAWSGPGFKIWRRDDLPPNFTAPESMDIPECPVFDIKADTSSDTESTSSHTGQAETDGHSSSVDDKNNDDAMDVADAGGEDNAGGTTQDMDISADEAGDDGPGDTGDEVKDQSAQQPQPSADKRKVKSSRPGRARRR